MNNLLEKSRINNIHKKIKKYIKIKDNFKQVNI